jgi:hypothetical protein
MDYFFIAFLVAIYVAAWDRMSGENSTIWFLLAFSLFWPLSIFSSIMIWLLTIPDRSWEKRNKKF